MKFRFANKVEFYITNVCNLTCDNCNRFNNYTFRGHQLWEDYADTYRRWSDYIELKSIVLMGGEPLLNPSVKQWIPGLIETFGCDVQILTNGLQLNRVPGLYDVIKQHAGHPKKFAHLQISLHNLKHFDWLRSEIQRFVQPPFEEWGTCLGIPTLPHRPNYNAYYSIQDANNILINMHVDNSFVNAAVHRDPDGKFKVYNSDPAAAHSACGFVRFKSYHFIKGKIYKCGPVALFPEFDRQMTLDISDQERELMNQYNAFTVEQVAQQGPEVLSTIDNPIPQCRFCPAELPFKTIWPEKKSSKKITILSQ